MLKTANAELWVPALAAFGRFGRDDSRVSIAL
jgi:hypothetical protein